MNLQRARLNSWQIINMMIVIPMILQTVSFGWVYRHLLGNDPANAISFAGVLLFMASLAAMLIPKDKN